jgi:hypothetical protein
MKFPALNSPRFIVQSRRTAAALAGSQQLLVTPGFAKNASPGATPYRPTGSIVVKAWFSLSDHKKFPNFDLGTHGQIISGYPRGFPRCLL